MKGYDVYRWLEEKGANQSQALRVFTDYLNSCLIGLEGGFTTALA